MVFDVVDFVEIDIEFMLVVVCFDDALVDCELVYFELGTNVVIKVDVLDDVVWV